MSKLKSKVWVMFIFGKYLQFHEAANNQFYKFNMAMEINTIYKWVTIAVLVLSLLYTFIFYQSNMPRGLSHLTIVNVAYHGLYHFLRLFARRQIVGIMAIFSALFLTGYAIFETIQTKDYELLIVICVAAGLFLGGMKIFENTPNED